MVESERKACAEAMDISVISEEFRESLKHAVKELVTGDIVRMLLIQVIGRDVMYTYCFFSAYLCSIIIVTLQEKHITTVKCYSTCEKLCSCLV